MSTLSDLARPRNVFAPETPPAKFARCLRECREYLDRIEATGDPVLAESADGALWDAIMAHEIFTSRDPRPMLPNRRGS